MDIFDNLVELIASVTGLNVVNALRDEGYRETSFLVMGASLALLLTRLYGWQMVLMWRRRAEDAEARLQEARDTLHTRSQEVADTRDALTTAKSTIADATLRHAELQRRIEEATAAGEIAVSDRVLQELLTGQIWSRPVAEAHQALVAARSRIPILAVGNLKGGVGKTTCAANLGAIFASVAGPGKRTLFLDFDFQSSLSTLLTAVSGNKLTDTVESLMGDRERPVADRLLEAQTLHHAKLVGGCAYYGVSMDMTLFEDRITLAWLMRLLRAEGRGGGETPFDVRLILRDFLLSDAVQKRFDLVVIDLPPRNSALAYNGLCAATDLLVVTRPDAMSTDSIPRFIEYLDRTQPLLFPQLRIAGVAVNAVRGADKGWRERIGQAVGEASLAWRGPPETITLLPPISETVKISGVADRAFAVLEDAGVRKEFADLSESLHLYEHA